MLYFFTILFIFLILYVLRKMRIKKSIVWFVLGLQALFSIGYYILPVFFRERTQLLLVNDYELAELVLMALLFFFFLVVGVVFCESSKINRRPLTFPRLDSFVYRNLYKFFWLGFILWIMYFLNNNLTTYISGGIEAYQEQESVFSGLLGALSSICISIIAYSLSISIKLKSKKVALMIVLSIFILFLLLSTAQRLFLLTPLFTFIGALFLTDQKRKSFRIILISVLILIISSPLLVFLRQSQENEKFILNPTNQFSSKNVFEDGFNSLLDRSDLYFVMYNLKKYFDHPNYDFNHFQYYGSVFESFIPQVFLSSKSQVLSDNGRLDGEISVLAWDQIVGNGIGSLTSFGAISAYRQGGWLWLIFNGLFTGFLYYFFCMYFSRGGTIAQILFLSVFTSISIQQVPPSLMYFIVYIKPILQITILLFFLTMFFPKKKSLKY